MILYFKVASLKALLKKDIGYSKCLSLFYRNTPTIVCSEAEENNMKSLLKLGLTNTGHFVSACLISMKYCLA